MPLLLTILAHAGILALGAIIGYLIRAWREPDAQADIDAAWERGRMVGQVQGQSVVTAMRLDAYAHALREAKLVAELAPKSVVGRSIVRRLTDLAIPKAATWGGQASGSVSPYAGAVATGLAGMEKDNITTTTNADVPFTLTADAGEGEE